MNSVNDLLNTVVDPHTNTTLREELQGVATEAISFIKEFLRNTKLDNEKIEAETLLILEKARDIYERRQSELEDAKIDRETKVLNNFQKKIEIAEKLLDLYKNLEPNSVINILGKYAEQSYSPLHLSANEIDKPKK